MRRFFLLVFLQLSSLAAHGQHALCVGSRFADSAFAVTKTNNVVYGNAPRHNGQAVNLFMDIYAPGSDTATNRPVVVLAHGGTFLTGNEESVEVVPLAQALAARGYVAVSITYRLDEITNFVSSGNEAPVRALVRAVQDGRAAVRFLRRSVAEQGNPYGIDTTHLYFGGVSAGAFIALHMAYISDFAEFSQFGAIANHQQVWDDLGGLEGNSGSPGHTSNVQGVINLCGGLGLATWIQPGDIPVISMHGTADQTVPYGTGVFGLPPTISIGIDGSGVIDSVARARGVDSRLYTWFGADHVPFAAGSNPAAYRDTMLGFVTENLYEWVCTDTTAVGTTEARDARVARVAPNPARGAFHVLLPAPGAYSIQLFDLQGRTVYAAEIEGNQAAVPCHSLPAGLYLLQGVGPLGQRFHSRVVVE